LNIVLVDDHALFREALRVVLQAADPRLEVVGDAASSRDAVAVVERLRPDLVLMDVILQGTSGIAATRELRRSGFAGQICMLTSVREPAFVVDAFAAGADGYALKDQSVDEIVAALWHMAHGSRYLTPRLEREVAESTQGMADGPSAMESLSAREREVFGLVTGGYTNNRIAAELFISVKTVATHRSRINRKLRVHSTGELIRLAALHGMVSI
jgi:DNA-binding NarL/FixJ family response regulator